MPEFFETKESPQLGRYSISSKNLAAGEIIFEEYPFVVGPKPNAPPVCLVCCCPVDGSKNGPRCPHCRWPLCTNCVDDDLHRKECQLFVENKVIFHDFPSYDDACMQLDCITPLRLLLEKERNPKRWHEEICLMEHHKEIRHQSKQWNADDHNIVKYFIGPCKLKGRFSKELIQQACGILEVNSFEACAKSGSTFRCIFPKTAIMAHCCVPNTTHSIHPSDRFKIIVRASVDICKGDILYTTYTNLLEGTAARQQHLKNSKFFTCQCERCNDPTELGTHFSSLKCQACDPGYVYSTDFSNINSSLKCSHCDVKTKEATMRTSLSFIRSEFEHVQSIDFGSDRLTKCELLFRRNSKVLHPQHYIQMGLRQSLIELYGSVTGYELNTMTAFMLDHKIDLCLQVLNILKVIYPGKNRTRAMLMYELHAPLVFKSRNEFASGTLQGYAFKTKLKEAINLLDECIEILEWEDVATVEYKVAQVAKKSLAQLKEILRTII